MEMTTDDLLEEFKAAWLRGMAPRADLYVELAAPTARGELASKIGDWLGTDAPAVELHPEAAAILGQDPLAQRLARLEEQRWRDR